MNQLGSIFTPGTSIQGQLLRHAMSMRADDVQPCGTAHSSLPVLAETLTQCGVPAVLPYGSGSLRVFVAGQVHFRNSPYSAPWPLLPLYLHSCGEAHEWELTRLPDRVHDRPYFVSGIPSAVSYGGTLLVYFNGAQLLEYTCSPEHWWQVAAVPTPDMVVEANPVAAIAAGKVFVFCVPRGESLLMCSRTLATSDWNFADLGTAASVSFRACDGDPAVALFANRLHVFISASVGGSKFELWDIVVNPLTFQAEAVCISTRPDAPRDEVASAVLGTPSAVADATSLRVFARSADDRLLEYSSLDGRAWNLTDISASTSRIGGDPGAALSQDGAPLVCATDRQGNLLQFAWDAGSANWRAIRLWDSPNDVPRRPIPVLAGSGLSVFDLKVPM